MMYSDAFSIILLYILDIFEAVQGKLQTDHFVKIREKEIIVKIKRIFNKN